MCLTVYLKINTLCLRSDRAKYIIMQLNGFASQEKDLLSEGHRDSKHSRHSSAIGTLPTWNMTKDRRRKNDSHGRPERRAPASTAPNEVLASGCVWETILFITHTLKKEVGMQVTSNTKCEHTNSVLFSYHLQVLVANIVIYIDWTDSIRISTSMISLILSCVICF